MTTSDKLAKDNDIGMDTTAILSLAIDALEDVKAKNIVQLDVGTLTTVTDHMVIATGTSSRHVRSLASTLHAKAKHAGCPPLGAEADAASDWELVDLGAVIVHIMQAEARDFYDLERLWNPALTDPQTDELNAAHAAHD